MQELLFQFFFFFFYQAARVITAKYLRIYASFLHLLMKRICSTRTCIKLFALSVEPFFGRVSSLRKKKKKNRSYKLSTVVKIVEKRHGGAPAQLKNSCSIIINEVAIPSVAVSIKFVYPSAYPSLL